MPWISKRPSAFVLTARSRQIHSRGCPKYLGQRLALDAADRGQDSGWTTNRLTDRVLGRFFSHTQLDLADAHSVAVGGSGDIQTNGVGDHGIKRMADPTGLLVVPYLDDRLPLAVDANTDRVVQAAIMAWVELMKKHYAIDLGGLGKR